MKKLGDLKNINSEIKLNQIYELNKFNLKTEL